MVETLENPVPATIVFRNRERLMEERRYTRQKYFSPGTAIAVYRTWNQARDFLPASAVRFRRDFWKISYVEQGSGVFLCNEERYPFGPGFIILSHPDDLTTVELKSDIRIYNILFFRKALAGWLDEFGAEHDFFGIFYESDPARSGIRTQLYQLSANRKIETLVREMRREFLREELNSPMLLRLYLMELLVQMNRLSERQFSRKRRSCLVAYVLSRLEKDFQTNFDYRKAAAELGITHVYLCSAYRKETGESIGQTQFRIRLKNVKRLLSESSRSVIEISTLCGFNDLSYFYRAFKKDTGMAPGDFRKEYSRFI
jgi:transcriptional regulator, araC family